MSTVAAVPVKDLVHAKQRLAAFLAPAERPPLVRAMLEDVLDALAAAPSVDEVWVVTRDDAVQSLARARGMTCLTEPDNRGHTAAVALAQAEARQRGIGRFLTLPGDVPCVTAAEIERLVDVATPPRAVAFAPSLSGLGTNGAALAPPDVLTLRFGEPSFANHLEAARRRGLSPAVIRLPGLGLDIDTPEDLRLLLDRGQRTRAAACLTAMGISVRLAARPAPV
ncbi:MAG: 2-phospho-L-lactate guanylyltransferase [Candidatus Rokubacteria bacterium]|nr:2-phospho-L-lactate guanylyltransferase [Candidatus Rokubacteria bacterium]